MNSNIFISLLEGFKLDQHNFEVSISGSYNFWQEAEKVCSNLNQYNVSYYPSCGNDVSDINLFYDNTDEEDLEADVFLRSDYLSEALLLKSGLFNCISNRFNITDHVKIQLVNRDSLELKTPVINLYKLEEIDRQKTKYVIHLGCVYNEKVLKLLLDYKIKTKLLHTKCDGVWWGMGVDYKQAIPTYLFPLFYKELQISYILSDKKNEEISSRIMDSFIKGEHNEKESLMKIIFASKLSPSLRKRLGNATSFQENACLILDNLSETRLLNVGLYLKKVIEK
jgi:hypothetical protein